MLKARKCNTHISNDEMMYQSWVCVGNILMHLPYDGMKYETHREI